MKIVPKNKQLRFSRPGGNLPACEDHWLAAIDANGGRDGMGNTARDHSRFIEQGFPNFVARAYARDRIRGMSRERAIESTRQYVTETAVWAHRDVEFYPPEDRPDPEVLNPTIETITRIVDAADKQL